MKIAAALVIIAGLLAPVGAAADEISRGADAIELFYVKKKILDPALCRSRQVDGTTYVLCNHPLADRQTGGLWAVLDGPVIVPVNGKAIGQLKRYGGAEIEGMDTRPLPTKRPQAAFETMPNIPAILSEF